MFVKKSTYNDMVRQKDNSDFRFMRMRNERDELRDDLNEVQARLDRLTNDWNVLVRRINAAGGEDFLKRGDTMSAHGSSQFSDDEIKKLVLLCHPDKHGGKTMAVEITQKLLAMRKS